MDALYSISSTVHTLAAVIWVGGMFFAHMILRPALMQEKAGILKTIVIRVAHKLYPVNEGGENQTRTTVLRGSSASFSRA